MLEGFGFDAALLQPILSTGTRQFNKFTKRGKATSPISIPATHHRHPLGEEFLVLE